ncbi:MAG: hypothetical protein ACK4HV_05040 [Parachlamydiaceae bacterium]
MAVQLDSILLQSWDKGIPKVGGRDDASNLSLIIEKALSSNSPSTRALLKTKIAAYLSKPRAGFEKLERACAYLLGVRVRFKDEEAFLPLDQVLKLTMLEPKYRYAYAQNKLSFPNLSYAGYKEFWLLLNGSKEISFSSLLEVYLTFESTPKIRETIEHELDNVNNPKLARFYYYLRFDSYFKSKIEHKVSKLSNSDYIIFLKMLGVGNIDWVRYASNKRKKIEVLAALSQKHDSALIDLKGEFFSHIKNKRHLKIILKKPFSESDVLLLKKNNPNLTEIEFVQFVPQKRAILSLISTKVKKIVFDRGILTRKNWDKFIEQTGCIDLVLKTTRINQTAFDALSQKLQSLAIEDTSGINFFSQIPVESLSITKLEEFAPQRYVRVLNVDCVNYCQDFSNVLSLFPYLHTFGFKSAYETFMLIDQNFFLKLFEGAPQLNKLILNGVRFGKIPYLRLKFLNMRELDIARTCFFESSPESLLNKLCFMFPNLQNIFYGKEDRLHNAPFIEMARERFKNIRFKEIESG